MISFFTALKVFNQIPFSKLSAADAELIVVLVDRLISLPDDLDVVIDPDAMKTAVRELIGLVVAIRERALELGFDLDAMRSKMNEPAEKD